MKNIVMNGVILVVSLLSACSQLSNSGIQEDVKLIPYKAGDDKVGYFDLQGNIKINPQFKYASLFREGLALVQNSEAKFGFINEEGNYVINPLYLNATSFSEGLAGVVLKDSKCQYINPKGEIMFTLQSAEKSGVFCEGLAWFKQDDKFGFIDKTGTVTIQPQFDSIQTFSEGLCPVMSKSGGEKSWGYINSKGEIIINYQFKMAYPFSEGLAVISDGTNSGYIDKSGKFIINPQYSFASQFQEGLAIIKQGDQYGYIDKSGKIVINPQFNSVSLFSNNGLAIVNTDSKFGYIDKKGKYVINPQFDNATPYFSNTAIAGNGEKMGIIDEKGKYIVNPQFNVYLSYTFYSLSDYGKNSRILSDYFDKSSIINSLMEGTSDSEIRHISPNTTSKQIYDAHDALSEYFDYSEQTFSVVNTSIPFGKYATCKNISYSFDQVLSEQIPIYRTEQRYNYYQGGYVDQQVLDHYDSKNNENAKIKWVYYSISLNDKAIGKGQEIAKGVIDEFQKRIGGSIVEGFQEYGSEQLPKYSICDSNSFPGCANVSYKSNVINVWAEFHPDVE